MNGDEVGVADSKAAEGEGEKEMTNKKEEEVGEAGEKKEKEKKRRKKWLSMGKGCCCVM